MCCMSWRLTATIIGWNAILRKLVKMTDNICFTSYVRVFSGLVSYFLVEKYLVEKYEE